ncbi:hypothetical protein GQ600_23874 [Phytophthora cactorum]|nr:hypothetical protein GQ600_23874 [Phytophthora cactorum]
MLNPAPGHCGSCGVIGGAIAHLHGNPANRYYSDGHFNYYYIDDHINIAADIGSNCSDAEQSLRHSMITVLGHGAINEEEFTSWSSRQKILGLIFDTVAGTVAMPEEKIEKAKACVASAISTKSLSRSEYRPLLGRLRHVATCVRPARSFLPRLRQHERSIPGGTG